jgi:Tol biopolymer transport system component
VDSGCNAVAQQLQVIEDKDKFAISAELGKILASRGFSHSERMSRFLRYVVEAALEGEADQIKEYLIGVDVFDKPASYDPRVDSTVRGEALKLRTKLAHYYEVEGSADPVLISMPKGGYAPAFEMRSHLPPAAERRTNRSSRTRWIAVAALILIAAAGLAAWRRRTPPILEPQMIRLTRDSGLTYQPAISPDGTLLAYASDRAGEGNLDIWVQQVAGGQAIRLTRNPSDDEDPSFSPDGSLVVFTSARDHGGIYVVPALGGDERLLVRTGRLPRFSPDGKSVVYSRSQGIQSAEIYIVPASGGEPVKLDTGFQWSNFPVWTADGKSVLFQGNHEPEADWWVVPVGGGTAVQTGIKRAFVDRGLTLGAFTLKVAPRWAGDDLLFGLKRGESGRLFRIGVSPDSHRISGAMSAAILLPGTELQPAGLIGGRLIFAGVNQRTALWSLPLQANQGRVTGDPERLTDDGADYAHPSLSVDGKKMVYPSTRSGKWELWLRDLESRVDKQLTVTPAEERTAKFSPDGSRVAYETLDHQSKERVNPVTNVMDSTGTGPAQVCTRCSLLDWSPDSGSLLFRRTNKWAYLAAINILNKEIKVVLQHPAYDVPAGRYSPDGRSLAFQVQLMNSAPSTIFIKQLPDGIGGGETEWIPVTDGRGNDRQPWWSPDGKLVYFISRRDGFDCFWAQRLDDTKHPAGSAIGVYHMHESRRMLGPAANYVGQVGPSMTNDRLLFSLTELTGNLWIADIDRQQQ